VSESPRATIFQLGAAEVDALIAPEPAAVALGVKKDL